MAKTTFPVPKEREAVWGSRMRAMAGSLCDRLALDDEDETVGMQGDPLDAKIRSIKANLSHILNVRSGGASASPELGVVDFNDCAMLSRDLVKAAAVSIRDCIVRYEPRLTDIRVENVSDPSNPLLLQFSITAHVPAANAREQVRIDILMEEGRSCRVV